MMNKNSPKASHVRFTMYIQQKAPFDDKQKLALHETESAQAKTEIQLVNA